MRRLQRAEPGALIRGELDSNMAIVHCCCCPLIHYQQQPSDAKYRHRPQRADGEGDNRKFFKVIDFGARAQSLPASLTLRAPASSYFWHEATRRQDLTSPCGFCVLLA